VKLRTTRDFGAVARDRRRQLEISQAELAERAGVTRQWVVRFERGADDLSLAKVLAVLRALSIELLSETPEQAAARASSMTVRIPRVEVPRIDVSAIDWTSISARLARANLDASALVDSLRQEHAEGDTRARREAPSDD
jgi:transcriptional regulator with XRE-family HTH domain